MGHVRMVVGVLVIPVFFLIFMVIFILVVTVEVRKMKHLEVSVETFSKCRRINCKEISVISTFKYAKPIRVQKSNPVRKNTKFFYMFVPVDPKQDLVLESYHKLFTILAHDFNLYHASQKQHEKSL
jgi:hypothetical protein